MKYLTTFSLLFLTCSSAQAVLTVRISGNGFVVPFDVVDGDANDMDGDAGEIAFDAAALPGWAAGDRFDITANNIQTHPAASFAGGQINVTADYDLTGGFAGTAITVSAADQFEVRDQTIDYWRGSTSIAGDGVISSSNHYFNSSTPITPADPFDFTGYGDVFNLVPGIPPTGTLVNDERSFFETPAVTLGINLQVANSFTVVIGTGDTGTIASTTIVNPEPASVLLSGFGAVLIGFGYHRRRKSRKAEEA